MLPIEPGSNGHRRGENGREPVARAPADYAPVTAAPDGVHVKELLGVLRRNWLLLVLMPPLCLGIAWYKWPKGPDRYSANAAIQILNARRALAIGVEDVGSDRLSRYADPLVSHIEILKGRVVLGRAVDAEGERMRQRSEGFSTSLLIDAATDSAAPSTTLHLRFGAGGFDVRAENGGFAAATYGEPVRIAGARFSIAEHPGIDTATIAIGSRDAAIDRIAAGLAAAPRRDSDIVDVFYTHGSPARAQRIANAVVLAHRQVSIDAAQERSHRRRVFLEEQLARADTRLAVAQGTLTAFRTSNQLVNTAQRAASQQQTLLDLSARIEELNAERRMLRLLLDGARNAPIGERSAALNSLVSASGIGSNTVVSALYRQLAQYETDRAGLTTGSTGVTQAHPQVQRLDELIASTRDRILDAAGSHIASLDERATALEGLRRQSSATGRALPQLDAEEGRLAQEVLSYRAMADQLRTELQRAEVAEAVEAGQVEIVYLAPTPTSPRVQQRSRKLTFAFLFGGMLGMVGAFGREALNTSVRRPRDITSTLHLNELAVVPRIVAPANGRRLLPRARRTENELPHKVMGALAAHPKQHASAEAYRTLRTNIIYSQLFRELKTVAVTSAGPQEGKSTTSTNMAAAFAQQGIRVLLIDADMRRPSIHRALRLPLGPGLSSVLRGEEATGAVIRPTSVPGLAVLTAGPAPANPAELLGGERMLGLLRDVSRQFDLVVIDTPPVLAAADAAIVSALADGAIFVVRAGHTETGAAQQALERIGRVSARVVGVVLNDPDAKVPQYGEYYDYAYQYAGDGGRGRG